MRAAQGLLLAREKYQAYCEIEVVAFPQEGIVRDPGAAELMDEAIRQGCDVVGGLPWYEYTDEEAREHIDICFDLAKRHDLDIHMLVDDTDDANSRSLEYLALKTMREDFHGRVAASHCGAMAGYNDVYAAKVIDMVATADVTISVNAHINLVCSARLDREPKRRGIARVKELLARGVNVVSSQDDVDDPYYPFGKPDQLEVALMMAHTAQLTLPHELEQVIDMVTVNAARAARLYRLRDRARQQGRSGGGRRAVGARSAAPAAAAPARDQGRTSRSPAPRVTQELLRPMSSHERRLADSARGGRARAQPFVRIQAVEQELSGARRGASRRVDRHRPRPRARRIPLRRRPLGLRQEHAHDAGGRPRPCDRRPDRDRGPARDQPLYRCRHRSFSATRCWNGAP